MTFFIVVADYFTDYIPKESLNRLDRGVIDFVRRFYRFDPAKKWEPTLRTAVLMFSDQQLVTGIAILASGCSQLRYGISSYHWQMIVYLAWFSSLTHLTTLTVLSQYFRTNPTIRLWRFILMFLMLVTLGVALVPTGDSWWMGGSRGGNDTLGIPASCYFKRLVARKPGERFEVDTIQTSSMIISVTFLFWGYLTKLSEVFPEATAVIRLWARTKPGRIIKAAVQDSIERAGRKGASGYWRFKHLFLETVYVLVGASFEVYDSILWEVRALSEGHTFLLL